MVVRSLEEEKWNAGTHWFGAAAAGVGLLWFCYLQLTEPQTWAGLSCIVYAASLVLMYVMSSLSHSFRDDVRLNRFRALDQACIFLLITATYTPLSLQFWNSYAANTLLVLMWLISISGFVAKVFFTHRVNRVSIIGYVALGWMPILGLPFHDSWPVDAMLWVLAGGIVYSLGTLFLINDQKSRWLHPAWHFCVIIASAIHFAAVAKFVMFA